MDGIGDSGQLHIVVFPWLAFGHMAPFLELSKALARRGHLISYLSTRRNIQRLPKIPPHQSSLITLVELTLPPTEGLPEDAESTMDLEVHKVPYLKMALDGLEEQVAEFLATASPPVDWVVHDFVQYWTPRAAARAAVPCAFFSVYSPWMHAFVGAPRTSIVDEEPWTKPRRWTSFAPWLVLRQHEAAAVVAAAAHPNATSVSDAQRFFWTIEGCRVVVLRGPEAEEIHPAEANWLALIQELYGKSVVSVGGLSPAARAQKEPEETTVKGGGGGGGPPGGDDAFFGWLGKQAAGSVVYVALGSEAELSPELIHELALGLEQSGLPFFWALRKPPGSPDRVELLPPGFRDRVGGRGIVTMDWVPQIRVLAHPSVGGFLTHSGWSSVIEGLTMGRPLALLPLYFDQCIIARAVTHMKAGVEIPRGEEDGGFTREGIAAALRLVMTGDQAGALRGNARRAGEVFGDAARSDQCVDDLIRCLRIRRPPPPAAV
ncbi:hypothetical protein Taro_047949 [Colocasia esculenta]|uniref:Glycosyltransferase n=1 Tax=Colocasia esculenta TaxID=4460 RepID=A0A843WWU0_COLES|nr:hypothetical protein [Colocasia esculenta]